MISLNYSFIDCHFIGCNSVLVFLHSLLLFIYFSCTCKKHILMGSLISFFFNRTGLNISITLQPVPFQSLKKALIDCTEHICCLLCDWIKIKWKNEWTLALYLTQMWALSSHRLLKQVRLKRTTFKPKHNNSRVNCSLDSELITA